MFHMRNVVGGLSTYTDGSRRLCLSARYAQCKVVDVVRKYFNKNHIPMHDYNKRDVYRLTVECKQQLKMVSYRKSRSTANGKPKSAIKYRPSSLIFLLLISLVFNLSCLVVVLANDLSSENQETPMTSYISQILNGLIDPAKYDKRLRPRYGEGPVNVGITIHVSSISAVSEVDMDFTLDFYLRQTWQDPRLAFGKLDLGFAKIKELTVGVDYLDKLWKPDTFFPNEKKSFFHTATTHNSFLRIDPEGQILTSQRLTVTATCPMNLKLFPMDTQECKLEIESYGYTTDDIDYYWGRRVDTTDTPEKAVAFDKFSLPQFRRSGYRVNITTATTSSGAYDRLYVQVVISRNLGFYLMNIILPAMLIVMISWVSFWLNREASPARVTLGVTTVLTMTTLITTTNNSMPKVSYIKGLDVFLNFCFVMVFASLVEYAIVSYLNKRRARRLQAKKTATGTTGITTGVANVFALSDNSSWWFGYSTKSNVHVLDRLTDVSKYDKRLRPRYGEGPVMVGITIHVSSISAVSEVDMDFTLDFYLRQTWQDPRLAFGKLDLGFAKIKELTVGVDYLDKLWKPDTFFPNEKKSFFHTATTHNSFLRIDPEGQILTSQRLTVTATCPMNLKLFPMDTQECKLEIESYGYTTDDIDYYWGHKVDTTEPPEKAVAFDKFSLPQFKRAGYRVNITTATTSSGAYDRLYFQVIMTRNIGFYLMNIIIPSMLIVSISWVSFWLNREASPARVGLGVTTVLTMTTLITTTNNSMPKVSYIKGLDVFLNFCFVMVFASLVEYAVVSYWNKRQCRRRQIRKNRNQQQEPTELPMFTNYPTTPAGGITVSPNHSYVYRPPGIPPGIPPDCDCRTIPLVQYAQLTNDNSFHQTIPFPKIRRRQHFSCRKFMPSPARIDRCSRIMFPALFIIFNLVYWTIMRKLSELAIKVDYHEFKE
ncbi:PHCl [Aphelenchoides besseyi]|nr:PHCl [Aphelenchoides besseyi]